jgi:CheY-like chemotaxis protein
VSDGKVQEFPGKQRPIRVLLLDDREENRLLRSVILRQHGYEAVPAASIEEAKQKLEQIDIAVLDYHLGAGRFGTDVAEALRQTRPQVPIIILSATLERTFGGVADMHLLKGYSSTDDMINALRSFEAKKRGKPVVVDARDFYYSRISLAMGDDIALEILDREAHWQYVNDFFAALFNKKRQW